MRGWLIARKAFENIQAAEFIYFCNDRPVQPIITGLAEEHVAELGQDHPIRMCHKGGNLTGLDHIFRSSEYIHEHDVREKEGAPMVSEPRGKRSKVMDVPNIAQQKPLNAVA